MSRYIDAERLKQILKPSEWGTPDERWVPEHEIGAMLDYFPAADIPRWIPVTERLPAYGEDVLLSVHQGYAFGEPDNWCVVGGLIDKEDITWATRYGFHDILYSNDKHTVWVSAWMPRPEPYKGGAEE